LKQLLKELIIGEVETQVENRSLIIIYISSSLKNKPDIDSDTDNKSKYKAK